MSSFKHFLTGCVLGSHVLWVQAASVTLSDLPGLTLEAAIHKTLSQSPGLRAAARQIEVAQAKQQQANLRQNPTLSATAEDFLGSGNVSGLSSMQTTLSLNFVLDDELARSRGRLAGSEADSAAVALQLARVDAAAETAHRFIAALGIIATFEARRAGLELAQQSLATIDEAVNAGRRHSADLHRAQTDVARARLALEDSEHELKVARHRLAARWGSAAPDFHKLEGDLGELPVARSWQSLVEAMDESPVSQQFLSEARLAQSSLALQRQKSRSPIEYQLGIRHLGASDEFGFVAGVSVPLGLRNQNQGNILAAELQLEVIDASRASASAELRAKLFELHEGLAHSLHQATVLKQEILPGLEAADAEIRAAFLQGRYSFSELQGVQQELLDTRQQLISTSVQSHRQSIEIQRLTGTTVPTEYAQ